MSRTSRIVVAVAAAVLVMAAALTLVVRARGTEEAVAPRTPTSGATGTAGSTGGSTPAGTTGEPSTTGAPTSGPTTGPTTGASPTTPPAGRPPVGNSPPGGAAAGAVKGRLASVRTWAFPLGADLDAGDAAVARSLAGYDLVVIDGPEASPSLVAALKAQGSIVLGYISVGTIEEGRSWTAAAQPYLLDHWEQWDETYADTSQAGYRDLIAGTVAPPILDKGFDGLFLDNVDMVDTHPAQQAGMVELVRRLGDLAHQRGGVLFTQNGDSSVDAFAPYLDGWNREDVSSTFDPETEAYAGRSNGERAEAVATIGRLRARGLLVTAVDYTADSAGTVAGDAVRTACAAGAVPYVSDIGLTRIPASPPRCG